MMKSCSLLLSFALATTSITTSAATQNKAHTTIDKKGFLMKVDFQFKNAKKSFQVKHDSIVAEDNKYWFPLTPAQDGVALLGKMQKQKNGTLMIEGMVVDTSTTPIHIQSVSIITNIGETASITSRAETDGTETNKVTMNIKAEPTTYTEKSISK